MADILLEARALSVSIGGKDVCARLDLGVRAGELWALVGTNGVGKTTLLHTLSGLLRPASGEVLLRGRPSAGLRRKELAREVGVMLQDTDIAFPLTVREAVLEGRHPFLHRFHWESPEDEALARRALEELGIAGMAERAVQTLSGGERRLVAAATLFVQDPPVFLLDEPNSHLDLHQQLRVLERVLARVAAGQRAAIVILHDVNLAVRFCSHALVLYGAGEVEAGPIHEALNERSIARAFRYPVTRVAGPAGPVFVPS